MPSLASMLARWRSTVFLLIKSCSAIYSLVSPSATLTTSSSRGAERIRQRSPAVIVAVLVRLHAQDRKPA
jgi:hypothetical protein